MIKRIAVALDGSSLSERALAYVYHLAKELKAQLLLLQISFWPEDTNEVIYMDSESGLSPSDYLTKLKNTLTDPAKPWKFQPDEVETRVVYKKSVYELGDLAAAEGADLLVMSTHGRSGLSLLVMGSIATGILKHTTLPVVLVRPEETGGKAPFNLEAKLASPPAPLAVATLDGYAAAEACLPPACEICAQLDIPLYLTQVVTPMSDMLVAAMGIGYGYATYDAQKEIQNLRKEAYNYLEQVKAQLRTAYPQLKVEMTILVGDPAKQIEEYIHKLHPLFVAMATHARGEFSQILLGSVPETVVRHSHQPVLLARIPQDYKGFALTQEEGKSGVMMAGS